MDNIDLNSLNCPQYVDFKEKIYKSNDLMKGLAGSPACSSIVSDIDSTNVDTEDESSVLQHYDSQLGDLSALSGSYLDSSYQGNTSAVTTASLQTEDFPVNCLRNLSLPENASKKNSKPRKTTKVQPFHFAESKKRKRENDENVYIPMAEQIIAFQKKTPERFHTKGPKSFEQSEHWVPQLVRPKSPNLRAAKRMRGVNVPSREELEEKEVEEIKKYKFRARKINQNVLRQPHLPKIRRKTPTKPKEPHLNTAQRAAETYAKGKTDDEKTYNFRARPVPKAILNGPTGLKEKQTLRTTEAKTPKFALKDRAKKWKAEHKNNTEPENQKFKAVPLPVPAVPFVVKHEKKRTEIQPFSFDSKDQERMIMKEQKIKEEIEKESEVFVFKAQPMPSPSASLLPAVEKKPPTIPQPFNLRLDDKISRSNSFDSSLNSVGVFKAQPATVLVKPPFIPEKSSKQPVEVKEFHLHTDIRASERLKLKEINDMKEHEKELYLEQLRLVKEEEERREIAKLRKEAVHKANPIRHYKPVEVKPSTKPPTEPVSPKFKTDERLQLRH